MIAFFICWAPFHVQRLIAIYGTNTEDHITSNGPWMEFLYLLMTYVSGVFYYVSTTINPILYNIMSNKFRIAFMVSKTKIPFLVFHKVKNCVIIPLNLNINKVFLYKMCIMPTICFNSKEKIFVEIILCFNEYNISAKLLKICRNFTESEFVS